MLPFRGNSREEPSLSKYKIFFDVKKKSFSDLALKRGLPVPQPALGA